VRTTPDLTDEAYALAKSIAREKDQGLARTISEIILAHGTAAAPAKLKTRNGFPVVTLGRRLSSEDVKKILDEDERP